MAYYRQTVVDKVRSWIGKNEADGSHKDIVDIYNSIKPLPRGYKASYTDSWCAITQSAAFHSVGYDDIFPIECSCVKIVEKAKSMGIWKENDAYVPKPGDLILYDWQDNGKGDNKGTPDHIGMVEKVTDKTMTIIEGNYQDKVKRRTFKINNKCIRGFITPKFTADKKTTTTTTTTKSTAPSKTVKYKGKVSSCAWLNVRTWAGTEYKKAGFGPLVIGTKVDICDTLVDSKKNKWYYICYKGKYGFVSAKYVK